MGQDGEALLERFLNQGVRVTFAKDFSITGVLKEIGYDGSVLIEQTIGTAAVPTWVPVATILFITPIV